MSAYESVLFHRMLVADTARMEAYRRAIQEVVSPGSVVLDAGAGSGVLALLCCQAGAARVYAVERSEIIALAAQLIADNGMSERVQLLHADLRGINLPERVDVIVSELVGKAVAGQGMATLIGSCRDRFLKPGGRIVPETVDLMLAPVQAEREYATLLFPPSERYGIDFSSAQRMGLNSVPSFHFRAEQLLAAPARAYRYGALAARGDPIEAEARFQLHRNGTLHGFCGWFEASLVPGVTLTNAPPGTSAWDNAFFPLSDPLEVQAGDEVELRVVVSDQPDVRPHWLWRGSLTTSGSRREFKHSSFLGVPVSASKLQQSIEARGRPICGD